MRKLPVNNLKSDTWMIVDNFAGGGGASSGIRRAVGRDPDVAINHNAEALAMHRANHPETRHYETDVFDIDPRVVCRNNRVGLAWFSPDCTHHSKARGGKPIRNAGKKSRSLAWVVVKWAQHIRPRVIMLEKVEEWIHWGPVVRKVGTDGSLIVGTDGTPWYVPCPRRRGKTFRRWVRKLRQLGYAIEWRELRACDFGAPTVRKRLFVIARCDGEPIVWPTPTHGKPDSAEVLSGVRKPWRTAAFIIDWALPCPSIFLSPEEAKVIGVNRPLAENTMNRIAAGLKRYVLNCAKPFTVVCNHGGDWFRGRSLDEPTATITASNGDALVTPYVTAYHGPRPDGTVSRSSELEEPVRTLDTQNRFCLVTPVMTYAQQGGSNRSAECPVQTITASTKDQNAVIAPFLASPAHSTTTGRGPNVWNIEEPLRTVTSSNDKCVVTPTMKSYLSPSFENELKEKARQYPNSEHAQMVQAFIAQHNGGVIGHPATKPLSTITQRGTQQQVVEASFLTHNYTSNTGGGNGDPERPLKTVVAGGQHHAQVKAFLTKYYGGEDGQDVRDPLHTVTSRDRMGLVTVEGIDYEIIDIGMRMLTARELFKAQGFDDDYIIDCLAPNKRGKLRPLPKDAQVRLCGNSVCPDVAAALVSANCGYLRETKKAARRRQLQLANV